MRKSLLLFCFVCLSVCARAQIEFTIPYADSTLIANNTAHVMDNEGNVFLLSYLTGFYKGPTTRLEGGGIAGTSVQKIDFNNHVDWEHSYATELNGSNPSYLFEYPMPASQIFLWNNTLAIPYNIDLGQRNCIGNPNQTNATYRNGILVLNELGATVANKIFYEDSGCGEYDLQYVAQNAGSAPFTFVYTYMNNNITTTYLDKRNASFVDNQPETFMNQSYSTSIMYDPFAGNYIGCNENAIQVYDTSGLLLRTVKLPLGGYASNSYAWKMAVNAYYYVLNFNETDNSNNINTETIVLSKHGDLISLAPSPVFNDMKVTSDNQIWALVRNATYDSSNHTPVTFMQMDMFQNIKRKKKVGKPMTDGIAMSITNNDIIITGNCAAGNGNDSITVPSQLYFYKEAISDIPLLPDTSRCCTEINIFPNPATNVVHIISNSFNTTYGATIALYNTLGQRLGTYSWDLKALDIDVSLLAKGMYYIRASYGNKNICTQKIVKL